MPAARRRSASASVNPVGGVSPSAARRRSSSTRSIGAASCRCLCPSPAIATIVAYATAVPQSARDKHRAAAVVHDVVGHASEQEPSLAVERACTDYDQVGLLGLGRGDDALSGLADP